jgi:hypothetical protein
VLIGLVIGIAAPNGNFADPLKILASCQKSISFMLFMYSNMEAVLMRPTVPILIAIALTSAVATTSFAAPTNKDHQLKATQDNCPKGEICSSSTPRPPPKKQGGNLGVPNAPLPVPCAPGQKPTSKDGKSC